jgi:phosphoribosylaminoimidazole-succinocarboxamide synthase
VARKEKNSNTLEEALPPTLATTNFTWLGEPIRGKVRDCYVRDSKRILIATDRLSAFDKIITEVPAKGQVLTRMAKYWFDRTNTIIRNHVLGMPDPNVIVAREAHIIPVEVVVRGYLTGSAWRDYSSGRPVSGIVFPSGLAEFDKLPTPIVTPSTKAHQGEHDTPISEAAIVEHGIVAPDVWRYISSKALELFSFGSTEVEKRGLILVDTKYEFGLLDGEVVLADEIHTLDSSRFWIRESLKTRRSEGLPPEMLDKEPIRRWLAECGFTGEGEIPKVDEEYRHQLMRHYIDCASKIIGEDIIISTEDPLVRIERALRELDKAY